nr:universal stress protein [Bdellovibrio sp. CKG001]BFD64124.1 universal stress protein [Bdellovibrio sp. HM001]BFD68316.1 universal stress protein [Bdellovibrio sp. HAGR004]
MSSHSLLIADELEGKDEVTLRRSQVNRKFASDLSVRLQCSVDLIYVKTLKDIPGRLSLNASEKSKLIAQKTQQLAPVMKSFTRPGKLIVKFGSPLREISNAVKDSHNIEALILGSRALSGMDRFFLGSVAEEVVRYVKRPVFILGPGTQNDQYALSERKELRLIIATDLTKKCRAAETYGISLAKRLGAKVLLYHSAAETLRTVEQYVFASGEATPSIDSIFEDIKKDAIKSMEKRVTRLKAKGIDCESHIEMEKTPFADTLLASHKDSMDLICMGDDSSGGLFTSLLGSNLRDMIAKSPVPVVVVRG